MPAKQHHGNKPDVLITPATHTHKVDKLYRNTPPICVLQALATLEAISLLADKRELPVPVLPGEISNCHALNRIDLYRGNRLPSPGCRFAATAQ